MILLLSTGGKEIYKEFVLRVLCYPTEFVLADVPYSVDLVQDIYTRDPAALEGSDAVICFIEYVERGNATPPLEAVFIPLRLAQIEEARRYAGKLLLRLRLGDFVYYNDAAKRAYMKAESDDASRLSWNQAIKRLPLAPHAKSTREDGHIDPRDGDSWHSSGKFVIGLPNDFELPKAGSPRIRAERDDWKNTIDIMAGRTQLADKLFYQIGGLRGVGGGEVSLSAHQRRSVYALAPGTSVDLTLHFYYGDGRRTDPKRTLEVVTPAEYLTILGNTNIEVDPAQKSGKVETVRIRAKRQLAEELSYLAIRDKTVPTAVLASTELYFRITPRWEYVGLILGLFFVGSLMSGLPADFKTPSVFVGTFVEGLLARPWLVKVLGSCAMAGAFYLGFSKFPSKSGG